MKSRSCFVIALSMLVLGPAVAIRVAKAQDHAQVPTPEANPGMLANPPHVTEIPKSPDAPPDTQGTPRDEPVPIRFGGPAQSSHRLQTGFSVLPGTGYRLIVPYKENHFCGDRSGIAGSRVCTQFVPFFTELQLSFGVSAGMDVLLDVRIGLADEPSRPNHHAFMLSPGLRFWLDRTPASKFYSTLQVVYDYVDFSGFAIRSSDYGVRNVNGFMVDPRKNLGLFVQFGETIGFVRWFRIDLDLSLGIQLRLP